MDDIEEYVDLAILPYIIKVLDEFHRNTTPKAKKEADVSLINKLIDDLLKIKENKKLYSLDGYHADIQNNTLNDKRELRMDCNANIVSMVVR
ncbi:hypothetical protein NYE71_05905 [Bacillus sp. FSL K6-0273]|nr:hypothetical protein [Bacillus cereus]